MTGRQGAVAAGNADTAAAAADALRAGGNAVDAALAGGFAAAVAEPGLSSLGGGGFLLVRTPDGAQTLVDFFVDAPGRGRAPSDLEPDFLAVTVRFAGAEQVFHAGWASVAVPGCLPGYLHAHGRFGRLPFADVVAPARRLATEGAVLDRSQALVLSLLERILTLTPEGRSTYLPRGRLPRIGERLRNAALADFLDDLAAGRVTGLSDPRLAAAAEEAMDRGCGLLTAADLAAYEVVERAPLTVDVRGAQVATNPPPSFGGTIIAEGLAALGREPPLDDSPPSALRLAEALVMMSERHGVGPQAVRGTTHVSVIDADGGAAAMTTSNGSCSGVFLPGTGVQLNNVMGEADLHPHGFHRTAPGTRIGSMMAPTIVTRPDGGLVVLGSGGSERIRSALTCVLVGLLDRSLSLAEAVLAPRAHWDRTALQMEPGWPERVVAALAGRWPVRTWTARDLYFGGAHAVSRAPDGTVTAAGDDRRGGVGVVVDL